jgi:lipoprotein-anchoring transpeptidase ErfK/SrfK
MYDTERSPGRVALVLILAAVLLAMLTVSAWASWGVKLRNGLATMLAVSLTATPTKTPHPETPGPTQVPVALAIPTRAATEMPTIVPGDDMLPAKSNAEPLPAHLATIAHHYGIDSSRRFIVVDVAAQEMTIWDPQAPVSAGGTSKRVREMPISTGDESRGYRTPAWYGLVGKYWGTFHTGSVYADEGWYLFEDSGSILIHSAPYRLVDGVKVYEQMEALGKYPASRGCIRLSPEDAHWFTEWDPQGVPLVILSRQTN